MKKKTILNFVLCIAILLMVVAIIYVVGGEETYRSVQVQKLTGKTAVSRKDNSDLDAYYGMKLQSGDDVEVMQDSNMVMKLDQDKYVYAEANTKFHLETSGKEDSGKLLIKLEEGSVLVEIQEKLAENESFEVETPNSVLAVRGTVFYVAMTVNEAGEAVTQVSVFDGEVEVGNGEDKTTYSIAPGMQAVVEGDVAAEVKEQDIVLEEVPGEVLGWLVEMEKETFFEKEDMEIVIETKPTAATTPEKLKGTIVSANGNVAIVKNNKGMYGAADYEGNYILAPAFKEYYGPKDDGSFMVTNGKSWFLYDSTGSIIEKYASETEANLYDGGWADEHVLSTADIDLAEFEKEIEMLLKTGIITEKTIEDAINGKPIPGIAVSEYTSNGRRFNYYENYIAVDINIGDLAKLLGIGEEIAAQSVLVDFAQGSIVAEYEYIELEDAEYLLVRHEDKYFYIDYSGNVVSDTYDMATGFNDNGYAAVMKDGKAYAVDVDFKEVMKFENADSIGMSGDVLYKKNAEGEIELYYIP